MLFGARWWLDRQWYVGPAGGSVAIYQGIPLTILGYDLGHPVEVHKDVPAKEVRDLEDTYPQFDDGIPVTDREDGAQLIDQMERDLVEARAAAKDAAGRRPVSAVAARSVRPRTGLLLLLVALVVSVAAYAMVGLGLRGRVPRDIVVYGLTLGGAYLLAWGAVRWIAPRADPVLLPIAGMLGGLGLAMIYRLLPGRRRGRSGDLAPDRTGRLRR